MKSIDIIRRAGRNLSQAKLRTALTALAISIGAFVIMTSLAFGVGINAYTDSLIGTNINERTLAVSKQSLTAVMSGGARGGLKQYSENYSDMMRMELLDKSDIEKVEKVAGIQKVVPYYGINMKYFTIEGDTQKWSSSFTTYDYLIQHEAIAGKMPARGHNIAKKEIIIPEDYLKDLGMTTDSIIGKNIAMTFSIPPTEENIRNTLAELTQITPEVISRLEKGLDKSYDFTVVAISKNMPMSMNSSMLLINEDYYAEIGKEISRGTESYEKYVNATAIIDEGAKPEEVQQRIKDETGLSAMTARELQEMISQITNVLQIVVTSFGILSLIVSVFGIINTLYVSVIERTSQIGLMKSLGMRSKHVSRLFLYEAAWVGFIGGVIGVGLSWIIGNAMNPWISKTIGFNPEDHIYLLKYNPAQSVILIAALVIIAIASGFFPARKAAKLDPIEALKTE